MITQVPSKVKETLKDPDMALDNISNTCLFGEKFKKKLLKDTNAKQKPVDNLPGKPATGNHAVKGHIDFCIGESRVHNKLSKVGFESFSSESVSQCRNRFPHYDSTSAITKEGTDHFAVPGSIESIRCLIKANDSTDRSSFINSNKCSCSTFPVPIFTTSTNSRNSRVVLSEDVREEI